MTRRIGTIVVILAAAAVAFWAWTWLFPSPEKAIRKRLEEVAQTASFPANEGSVAKFQESQKLISFCTPDVEVGLDAYGQHITCTGKDELLQALMFARTQALGSLDLKLLDPVITFAPAEKDMAFINLTATGKTGNEKDAIVQECKFTMKKDGRSWLIRKVETVKTLR